MRAVDAARSARVLLRGCAEQLTINYISESLAHIYR
jgi:hypothetical protein